MIDSALTTSDNPFSPFTQWDDWKAFDDDHGYKTCELLNLFCKDTSELSENEYDQAVDEAMLKIIELNPLGIHKIVTLETH